MDVQGRGRRFVAIELLVFGAIFALLFAVGGTPQAALPLLLFIPVATRIAMLRVWVDGDRLHARNFWRTLDVSRAEIAGFDVEDTVGGRYSRQRTVYLQSLDRRTRRLTATARTYGKLLAFRAKADASNEADEICARLNDWLRTGA